MKEKAEKISITLPGNLLTRVDAIADGRGESRSAVLTRMVSNEVPEEEAFLRGQEYALNRIVLRALTSSSRVLEVVSQAVGDEMTSKEAAEVKAEVRRQAARGRERAKGPKTRRARVVRTGG